LIRRREARTGNKHGRGTTVWDALEWVAWIASAAIFLWMLFDAWRVGRDFSEAVLLSSREGVDELVSEKKGS
jgi:hypothetical protein